MNLKGMTAFLISAAMLIQPVCVNAEGDYEQGADVVESSSALFVRDVEGTDGIRIVKNANTDWLNCGNMNIGSYYLEDKNGERLTEDYIFLAPLAGSAGLYEYAIPAGHSDMWCGVIKLNDGQVSVLEEAGLQSYRGIDCGNAAVYYPVFTEGEYYDADGNKIEDLGVYLKPYGISLQRDKWAEGAIIDGINGRYVPPDLAYNYRNSITRREYCRLAIAAYEYLKGSYNGKAFTKEGKSPFTDVEDSYVSAAAELGIVNGMGNGSFEPDRPITRQEAAVLLCGLAEVIGRDGDIKKVNTFSDDSLIGKWAKDSVYKICGIKSINGYGIMEGVGKNKFAPTAQYTREQAIVTISRLLNQM